LILAANVPAMCSAIIQLRERKELTQREAELQVLGTTHAELAAGLLGNWGLPVSVLEAVAWHLCPTRSGDSSFTPLTAVHAANVLAGEMSGDSDLGVKPENFDHSYLLQIGLGECRNKWRETCGLAPRPDEEAEYRRVRLRRDAKRN
jgi:HD-like signal output (HDOD) protein